MQKPTLEKINYELEAKVNDVTDRLNYVESCIHRMNTRKEKLDEMLQIRKPTVVKIDLGYMSEKELMMNT